VNRWQKWISWAISPTAIGLLITIVILKLTFDYYGAASRNDENTREGLVSVLRTAHQKSIDFRLKMRGPRPVDKNLALLAVDERAVQTIGRWPWPRDVLAKLIQRALDNGVKVLAFDMAFPEPQQNPVELVEQKARAEGKLSADLEKNLSAFKEDLDADRVLGDVYAKNTDRIVAGAFSSWSQPSEPEAEFCHDLVFKRTAAAKQWDKEEVLISVNDDSNPYVPAGLIEVFNDVLGEREKVVKEKFGHPKNRAEEVQLENTVMDDLHLACATILDDFKEELNQAWSQIASKEDSKTFNFPSYDAWLANFREKSKHSAIPSQEGWKLNVPEIARGTKHTGHFNTELDSDGTIRNKALINRTWNSYFPALSLKAYLLSKNYNASPRIEYQPATGLKEMVDLEITSNETGDTIGHIPVDPQGRLLINYAGPAQMYPYFSFADLFTESPDAQIEQTVFNPQTKHWAKETRKIKKAEFLKDKIMIVGATAKGIYDLRVTPFEENYPGAETHLNAIDNIISGNYFRTAKNESVNMLLTLAVGGTLLTLALSYVGALMGMAVTLGTILGTVYIDQHYLFGRGIVVTIIWPLFLTVLIYVSLTFYRYFTEERGKKELRQTFQKYVSPAIVEEILAHPDNIQLGGKKVNLTVMFSDVRGFTTISEKLDPQALGDLLNSYLTPMTEIVFKNQGTLDKYMGDAIMAFFGAPIGYSGHAKAACRCALQSVEKLFQLQKEYERKGLPMIDLGIGLNTGDVSAGNMGSETVRSYTVMGDAVNLASRLEGINKQYGTRIILSEMTYEEVKDSFICREVDWVRVKGKAQPVKIYELISEHTVPNQQTADMLEWFRKGYALYHKKSWSESLTCFSKALDINPKDEVSKVYVERCQDYLTTPPPAEWDGVFVMKTK
jgi:adenylate cyclase